MDIDLRAAEAAVRADVAASRATPGRRGWVRERALARIGEMRDIRREAERAEYARLLAAEAAVRVAKREAAFAEALSWTPCMRPTRVHFAKGVCSATVPAGTVAVTGSESSRLIALGEGGVVLAVWRARQNGPSAWAEPASTEGVLVDAYAAPFRRPGVRSETERVFGVAGVAG